MGRCFVKIGAVDPSRLDPRLTETIEGNAPWAMGVTFKGQGWGYCPNGEGGAVAIAGIERVWDGRWALWSHIHHAALAPGDWKRIVRFARVRVARMFELSTVHRIEATAELDVPGADRLLRALGFKPEGVLRGYLPGGKDAAMYAVTRESEAL